MEKAPALPHIVVLPFPAQGHINPGLQFSHLLASSLGLCTVTFVNTTHIIAKLRAAHDPGPSVRFEALADDGQHGDGPDFDKTTEEMGGLLENLLMKLLSGGGAAHDWPPPVCIVADVFLGWAQDVADKLGLPRFILFTPSPATLVLMLCVPDMIQQGRLPCSSAAAEVQAQPLNLPGLTPTLHLSDAPSHLLLDPSAFMFGFFHRHCKRIPHAAAILLNTFYELESPALDAARDLLGPFPSRWAEALQKHLPHRVIPVGPLLPSHIFDERRDSRSAVLRARSAEDERCLQWLGRQAPSSVVYVSFGSMAELPGAQIQELALGLEASGKPFLWVVRAPSAGHLPPGFAARMEATQGLVVSWAPQLDVLSHPSTAVFLSHCGWNSTMEGLCAGVAVLGWPVFAEQKMNCRFLVDRLKVAMEFRKGEAGVVGKEEVERVVREALETDRGRALRRRAGEVSSLATKAVSDGGASHENAKAFGSLLSSLQARH